MKPFNILPPRQSGLMAGNPYNDNPSYRIHFPVEGVVVGIHFPYDESNVSKREIEYDVLPTLQSLGKIKNAVLALGVHGITDDEEVLLKPATLVIPSGRFNTDEHGAAADTDGDRVIVQFVNGSFFNPIITNVLNHTQRGREDKLPTKYQGRLEILTPGPTDGEAYEFGNGDPGKTAVALNPHPGNRFRHHSLNGTHYAVDKNGDIFVNFKANLEQQDGQVDKKLVIQNEGVDLLKIDMTSGQLKVTFGETLASAILVQIADGAKSAVIGETLQQLWNGGYSAPTSLKPYLDELSSTIFTWVPVPNDGGASLKTALGSWLAKSLASFGSDILSTKVKIPNG